MCIRDSGLDLDAAEPAAISRPAAIGTVDAFAQAPCSPRSFQHPERDPQRSRCRWRTPHLAAGPPCFHQEIPRMTECILDQPISSAWPVASDWLETFLHDGGNRWDHRIASVMTADAVTAALAHTNRPVRLVGATTGATAQIGLQAHSTGQPQEWTALSPIAEDALPRLRRHTRHCGAEVPRSSACRPCRRVSRTRWPKS